MFMERISFLKRSGYALVASSLILLLFLSSVPVLNLPSATLYAYGLFGTGILAVLLGKILQIIHYGRVKKLKAYCTECGWYGSGQEWYQSECCPECDSENVSLAS